MISEPDMKLMGFGFDLNIFESSVYDPIIFRVVKRVDPPNPFKFYYYLKKKKKKKKPKLKM
jgi:hypothetical protein